MPSKTKSTGHLSIGRGTRVTANQNRKSLTTLLIAIPNSRSPLEIVPFWDYHSRNAGYCSF